MKKIVTFSFIGTALLLSACASNTAADYSYESQAPYAASRTAGGEQTAVVQSRGGDAVFSSRQRK